MASDLSQLPTVDEQSISNNCRERYDKDEIYTTCGRLLIAVNPYKALTIYGEGEINRYHGALDRSELPPHIYAMAAAAYQGMVKEGRSQSVIISGESGAGKTETSKFFLEFMARVGKGAGSLHEKVLQTNPILEAFGNARTALNDNSSRFGKFLRLEFTASGKMCGASLRTYLLEKTRVTMQGEGEQNYHAFYLLTLGGTAAAHEAASIDGKAKGPWALLANSERAAGGKPPLSGKTFAADFEKVALALESLGVSADHAAQVWGVVGAVLHSGQLVFAAQGEGTAVTDPAPFRIAAQKLGLDYDKASGALTSRNIKVGAEVINKPNTNEEARSVRDALCKGLFANLFEWIVRQLNSALKATADAAAATASAGQGDTKLDNTAARFIGAVDVFGFESFGVNSLEQLCINYANERLQRLFVTAIFESQVSVYKKEGIAVPDIPFTDNAKVVALIDGPAAEPGILQILSEECVLGNSSDESFLDRVQQRFAVDKPNPHFARAKGRGMFNIKHFAAEVSYTVVGFVAKNKDPLPVDLSMLLKSSKVEVVAQLFNPPAEPVPKGGTAKRAGAFRSAKFVGVIDGFRSSLSELVKTLEATHTHFVRCIKPNLAKTAGVYEHEVAARQLRTSGVVQAVGAARAGYPDHLTFDQVANTYAMLVKGSPQSGRPGAEAVLKAAAIPPAKYQLGKTLVFMGVGVQDMLEARRNAFIAQRVVLMQGRIRIVLAKRLVRQLRDEKARAELVRQKAAQIEAEKRAKEEEERRIREEEERQKREAEEAMREQEEAKKKQQKFNIARQKSFERTAARKKKAAEKEAKAAAGEGDSSGDEAPTPGQGSKRLSVEGGPKKAVVTDMGWKESAGPTDDLDEAAAEAARVDYGFNNPVADVLEYAEYLGMDTSKYESLLWIADEALSAPEPKGWEQRVDPEGNVFYFHENTGMILQEHPLDHHYQNLYLQMKDQVDRDRGVAGEEEPEEEPEEEEVGPLPIDLGSLPPSVLVSKETLRRPSWKERLSPVTSRKTSRTHMLNLITFELTVPVKRKEKGLGVGLTVDNLVVEMDPSGSFAEVGDQLQKNDKIVRVDGRALRGRMFKDVIRPKETHEITVVFSREKSQRPAPREQKAKLRDDVANNQMRLKEYTLTIKRFNGSPGFTLDPTNLILHVEKGSDAASILKPGDKVVEVDGRVLEGVRFGEVADQGKAAHKLKVVRIKPMKAKGGKKDDGDSSKSSRPDPKRKQVGRIQFREVTLKKERESDRIGVLFHRTDEGFDMSAFAQVRA